MYQTISQNIYHANVNVSLMEENVIQMESGIMIHVDASVKKIISVKTIILAFLSHVVSKMKNI